MRLRIGAVPGPQGRERRTVEVDAGQEVALTVADANGLLRAVVGAPARDEHPSRRLAGGWEHLPVGTRWDEVSVQLDGRSLVGLSPADRTRAGLAVAGSRLPAGAELTVLDVVLLGWRPARPVRALGVAVGARRAREAIADAEASARGLAGRLGLAGWLDRDAATVPLRVESLADLTRAMLGAPDALVARWPAWLEASEAQGLARVVRDEAARIGTALLWVGEHGERVAGR